MRAAAVLAAVPVLVVLAMPMLFSSSAARTAGAALTHSDIPPVALAGYLAAADLTARVHADAMSPCAPSWALLAGIGKVETDHGRHGGSSLDDRGVAAPPILGVVLDGSLPGTRAIPDTDGGRLDGDVAWDRAVGPMQFIPSTWVAYARDGNDDGTADPQQITDAAATAGAYLCAHVVGDIGTRDGQRTALLAYNRSSAYVEGVLRWMDTYLIEAVVHTGDTGTGPIACPVVPPVSFIDSWHFPRSGGRLHMGQDMFAVEGQPLVALADATVVDIGRDRGLGGHVVWLVTAEGHAWYYAHLHSFAPGLQIGQQLRRGDPVGTVGRTGNARTTPPHLHIQWRPGGRSAPDVNPYDLLSAACPGHR